MKRQLCWQVSGRAWGLKSMTAIRSWRLASDMNLRTRHRGGTGYGGTWLGLVRYFAGKKTARRTNTDQILLQFQKDDRVCSQLFCFDAGSGYCVAYRPAAEGSPCGDGQVHGQ